MFRRRSLCGGLVVMSAVLLPSGAVAARPSAAPGENERTITIEIAAPPSLLPELKAGLWLGEEEVTDRYCEIASSPTSVTGRPYLRCTGLPDSSGYRLGLVDPVPPDVSTIVACQDETNNWSDAPPIPYASMDGWVCTLWASPPGVLLRDDPLTLANGELAEIGFEISSADGSPPPPCEPDRLYGINVQWCVGLPPGEQAVEVVPPAGYRADLQCVTADIEHVTTWDGSVSLSDPHPLWVCGVTSLAPPLSAVARVWDAGELDWVSGLSLRVVSPEGNDASAWCNVSGTVRSASPQDPHNPAAVWLVDCPGIGDGVYTVTLDGVPDHIDVRSEGLEDGICYVAIDQTYAGACSFRLDGVWPPTVPATSLLPVDTLPPTGGGRSELLGSGLALLLVGSVLGAAARRSPGPRRAQ